jgi:hypothetical protein
MNKLEQKIYEAMKAKMPDYMFAYYDMVEAAQIAAIVAIELAEEAHGRGYWLGEHNLDGVEGWEDFEDFKKEIL